LLSRPKDGLLSGEFLSHGRVPAGIEVVPIIVENLAGK
jgi:hypothetical protein